MIALDEDFDIDIEFEDGKQLGSTTCGAIMNGVQYVIGGYWNEQVSIRQGSGRAGQIILG